MSRNRRADWRRIKGRYSYTVDEAARALGVHRNTVRNWVRNSGLEAMTESRPHLILGAVLVVFLRGRRLAQKRKCAVGEIYCLKCRAPRKAVPGLLEQRPLASGRTQIAVLCSVCERLMYRFVANKNLAAHLHALVQSEAGDGSLTDTGKPNLNCHFVAMEDQR